VTGPAAKPTGPKPAWRRYGIRLVGIALFAAVLAMVDLERVWQAVSAMSVAALAEAALLTAILLLLKCLRWYLLLTWLGVPQRLGESVGIYADSVFWGTITPGRLGELKRSLYLQRHRRVPLARAAALWLIDQGFDLLAIAGLLLGAVLIDPAALGGLVPAPVLYAGAGLIVGGLIVRRPLLEAIRYLCRRSARLRYLSTEVTRDLIELRLFEMLALLTITIAALLTYVGVIGVLSAELPFVLTTADTIVAVSLVMLAALVPVSYLNLGSREVVLAALFAVHGLTLEDAVSFSFVFLICYLLLMPISIALARLAAPRFEAGPAAER